MGKTISMLDDTATVPFPDEKVWAEYYVKFRKTLVGRLNHGYCLADREDAVEEAFDKLMHRKDQLAYGENLPRTESDWFNNLYWQARASLSHMRERGERRAKYLESVAKELEDAFAPACQGDSLDSETRRRSIVRALHAFRREQDVSSRDLKAYLGRMRGIPSKMLAKRLRTTANNVDQIKSRIGNLLKKLGPRYFERVLAAA